MSNPPSHKPFRLSRRRLAAWYTGIMALILLICGLAIHRLVVHARWLNLVREMQQLASRLSNQIRPALQQPGQLDPMAQRLLPNLCLQASDCSQILEQATQLSAPDPIEVRLLRNLEGQDYCIRFINGSRQVLASLQLPATNFACQEPQLWRSFKDSRGKYYHNQIFPLFNGAGENWGMIQIAHSLNSLDLYLMWVELALVVLVLLGIGAVGLASWWLAGLALRPAKQSYQQMQQFTADAAHELRTPLAALQAIVQTALRSSDLTLEEAKAAFQILNRQNYRLSKLVQDLLILSQLDQSAGSRTLAPCCLNSLLQDLEDEFAALAMAAQIQLKFLGFDNPVEITADPEQIYRAISNLLSNALRYTSAQGKVTIRLSRSASHAVIQVEDTGIGILPDEQSRIFDRFYRTDQGRSQQQGGSGLGLAITQAIVRQHQGRLSLESEPGKGSLFTILLPLSKAKPI
ncbi:MAG: HAMP domain-containing histidine kinase [Pegethrix bostrychoides GSE-TBD4-15B]|uniref:histidine kinase n=1 Tax=Pegethrix bostrychoides GSE-TBD4-15B TaxID=2839662 RepID=A0A951PE33_9CYAN|nr:HAMP domain-containing histidine kinase [Pegethrix bostrychoides GSE-TBD4-15B]